MHAVGGGTSGGGTSGGGGNASTSILDPSTTTTAGQPELEPEPASSSSTSTSTGSTGDTSPVWRSSLYPTTWVPGLRDASDRGFADFSYAGYHHGEPPPSPRWPTLNLVDFGADPRGTTPSDAAFEQALAAAPLAGAILEFPAGRYRFDDRIVVSRSNLLVRGAGPQTTFLRFTRSEGMNYGGHIEFAASLTTTDETPLSADAPRDATYVELTDSSFFVPGDDVLVGWTLTEAFIASYGMEEPWAQRAGEWKPFFRRTVVSVDPDGLELDVPLRHDVLMRDGASVRRVEGYLAEVGLEGISISNATDSDTAWAHTQVAAVELRHVKDSWVRDVESYAAGPGGAHLQSKGISVVGSLRVSVLDSAMQDPQHRGEGGNGYLFEVSQSSEVLLADLLARNGRHNFIQNWEFGTSGCVFLRCHSEGSVAYLGQDFPSPLPAYSEFHHSLAMANLVDDCVLEDGWSAINRGMWSSGSGVSATESVFWNPSGGGRILSKQAGHGYVVAPGTMDIDTSLTGPHFFPQEMTAPEDFVEWIPVDDELEPQSLYEDQRARRLQRVNAQPLLLEAVEVEGVLAWERSRATER